MYSLCFSKICFIRETVNEAIAGVNNTVKRKFPLDDVNGDFCKVKKYECNFDFTLKLSIKIE